MQAFKKCVFDQFIPDTSPVFSSPEFHDELGLYDQLTFHAVADAATVNNTLTVDLMHSADQSGWVTETAAELSGSVTANVVSYAFGNSSDNTSQQGAAYRRLKVSLSVSPVHVKIYAVAHDQSVREPPDGLQRRARP